MPFLNSSETEYFSQLKSDVYHWSHQLQPGSKVISTHVAFGDPTHWILGALCHADGQSQVGIYTQRRLLETMKANCNTI